MTKRDILKVQMPFILTKKSAFCFVYNKDFTIVAELPLTKEVRKEMKGEPKKYFYYHLEPDKVKKNASYIILDKEAPWQDW